MKHFHGESNKPGSPYWSDTTGFVTAKLAWLYQTDEITMAWEHDTDTRPTDTTDSRYWSSIMAAYRLDIPGSVFIEDERDPWGGWMWWVRGCTDPTHHVCTV